MDSSACIQKSSLHARLYFSRTVINSEHEKMPLYLVFSFHFNPVAFINIFGSHLLGRVLERLSASRAEVDKGVLEGRLYKYETQDIVARIRYSKDTPTIHHNGQSFCLDKR